MGSVRHRQSKELVQEHTASRWPSWDLNPGYLAPALCSEELCSPHTHFSRMSCTFIQWRGLSLGCRRHALPIGPGWDCSAGFSAGSRKRAECSRVWGRHPPQALDHSADTASLQTTCHHHLELNAVPGPWQSCGCVSFNLWTWELWSKGLDVRPLCVVPYEQVKWIAKEKKKSRIYELQPRVPVN